TYPCRHREPAGQRRRRFKHSGGSDTKKRYLKLTQQTRRWCRDRPRRTTTLLGYILKNWRLDYREGVAM
ncbi:hypothetical protein A2U01_0108546, partial [Trifolium medium]|nr:hypothetical protein [Trifolium medium]